MANRLVVVKKHSVYEETFEVTLEDDLPEDEIRDEFKGKSLEECANFLIEEGEGNCINQVWVDWFHMADKDSPALQDSAHLQGKKDD